MKDKKHAEWAGYTPDNNSDFNKSNPFGWRATGREKAVEAIRRRQGTQPQGNAALQAYDKLNYKNEETSIEEAAKMAYNQIYGDGLDLSEEERRNMLQAAQEAQAYHGYQMPEDKMLRPGINTITAEMADNYRNGRYIYEGLDHYLEPRTRQQELAAQGYINNSVGMSRPQGLVRDPSIYEYLNGEFFKRR